MRSPVQRTVTTPITIEITNRSQVSTDRFTISTWRRAHRHPIGAVPPLRCPGTDTRVRENGTVTALSEARTVLMTVVVPEPAGAGPRR